MTTKRANNPYDLCQFQFANGKCCGMPAHPKYNGLCLNHGTIHSRANAREDDLSAELANPAGDYITQIDINHVLGKLFDALAAKRCSPRRASSLAYIAYLLAQTQKAAKEEARHWDSDKRVFQTMLKIKYPDCQASEQKTATAEVFSLSEGAVTDCHDPSTARPDAP